MNHASSLAPFVAHGERRKLAGMALAASPLSRAVLIVRTKVAMVRALLTSPDGTATSDDTVEELGAEFADGGKWRGGVFSDLSSAGIMEGIGYRLSVRPSRHRAPIAVWRLVNRGRAEALLTILETQLTNLSPNETSVVAATTTLGMEAL